MPQTLAIYAATALLQAGATVGVASAAFTAVTVGAQIAIAAGLSYVASQLAPKPQAPKPSDVKTNIAEPTSPRIRHYGVVRTSGILAFIETLGDELYKLIATGTDRVSAIVGYYVNDELVTVDASGNVNEFKDRGPDKNERLRIFTRMGLPTETAYSELIAAFPGIWTADHRGDGISSALMILDSPGIEEFSEVFPSGTNTNLSLVYESSLVHDPRSGATAFSENAALIIRDYLVSQWGFRLDSAWVDNADAEYVVAADVSDQAVALKAGGTEPRWRIGMSYTMAERPADVLQRMLDACDGMIFPTADMGLAVKVGRWEEPTVTLDETAIVAFSNLTRGGDVLSRANTVTARYTSRPHKFSEQEADPWLDDADIAENGEIASDMELFAVPSHSQCRRLMKIRHRRLNPEWRGTLICNLRGLAVLGERFIRVTLSDYGIMNGSFEIQGQPTFTMGEDGATVTGISVEVASMSAEAWMWDAALEEGTAPAVPGEIVKTERVLPVPTGFSLVTVQRTVQGSVIPFARFSADAPAHSDDSILFEISTDGGATWFEVPHDRRIHAAEHGPLEDGVTYTGRARTRSLTGRTGVATATQAVTSVFAPDLASNGGFSYDADWVKDAPWSIADGVAKKAAGTSGDILQASGSLVAGETYRITFDVLDYVGGIVKVAIVGSSTSTVGTDRTWDGTYTEDIVAPAGASAFGLTADATANLSVDNFSIHIVA